MKTVLSALLVAAATLTSAPASAVDGCTVLLCLAGPWPAIPSCRPQVEQLFRDLAIGRPFPACMFKNLDGSESNSADSGYSAGNSGMSEQNCPPMYSVYMDRENGPQWVGCSFSGVISVVLNGEPWEDVFWGGPGDTTSTHYYDTARAQLPPEDLDPRYDNDLAAWNASQVPPPPPPPPDR